jgi:farnesyl-diphosphate farnesyltransferase
MIDERRNTLLIEQLKGVSRAFYLTLRVLPRGLREPVGLAYLLARAADTIADTALLPANQRLQHLLDFRDGIEGRSTARALEQLSGLSRDQASNDERRLLESLPEAISMLERLPELDQGQVRSVVSTLTIGMEFDLKTFPAESSGRVEALADFDELDWYTYHVAGCVGEFWTAMAIAHTSALASWDSDRMSRLGVRFGKALQLTNVLRDVPRDLRIGRCYLPRADLSRAGLVPGDLLQSSAGAGARPVLVRGIETALEHFDAAEAYLLAIPRRCYRLRLSVLWPQLIGLATLAILARNEAWLDPGHPSKVSRPWIYRTLAVSAKLAPFNLLLQAWIAGLRGRVERALAAP